MKKFLLGTSIVLTTGGFAQMTTEGNAVQLGTCDCYQLTSDVPDGQNGAIWSPNTIDITNPFDFTFQVYLGNSDGGSDGIAYVLQSNPDGLGNIGYTLGYSNPFPAPNPVSANSIAIEIDTYNNAPTIATDIPSDHIGLSSALSNEHNLQGPFAIPEVEDGAYHSFHVIWTGAGGMPANTLTVIFDGIPYFAHTEDFTATTFAGNPNVYFGWTGATGYADQQVVCAYRNADFTPDTTAVCPNISLGFTDISTSDLNMSTSWDWDFDDGNNSTAQNPTHSWTTPGMYDVLLTYVDPFDCPATQTITIEVLPDLTMTMDSVQTTCYGDLDGQAIAVPTNGTGPYNYTWNDPGTQTSQTATGLTPGQYYTVVVVDNLGCTGTDSVMVTEPAELTLNMTGNDGLCNGAMDGSASTTTNNGVAPFNYVWNDPSSQSTSTATGLGPGTYTVIVTDNNGCSATDSVSITEPSAIVMSATTTHDDGTSNGTIDLTVSGGTAPYSYSWDIGTSTEDQSGLPSGTYVVTVTDANGCTDTMSVFVPSSVGFGDQVLTGFSIYPNPSTGLFYVKGIGTFDAIVLDMSGRIVLSSQYSDNAEIDLADFERGIYILEIRKGDKRAVERLILQ